jgi:hypothetical protein
MFELYNQYKNNLCLNYIINMKMKKPILTKKEVLDIALPVLKEKCSLEEFESFKPWIPVYNDDGFWVVRGTLPEDTVGGTLEIVISDKDRKIIDCYYLK